MHAKQKKSATWSAVRARIATWDRSALVALVKELYELAGVNRDFIHARCEAETGAVMESFRRRVVEQFFPARGEAKLKLAEARKAIRDYRKATGSVAGVAELLMTFVECGTEFTRNFGDMDERFYRHLESALEELAALLRGEAHELYPQWAGRLEAVRRKSANVGWGFADFVGEVVKALAEGRPRDGT